MFKYNIWLILTAFFLLFGSLKAVDTYEGLNQQAREVMFKNPGKAVEILRKAKEIFPDQPLAFINTGHALLLMKENKIAEASLEFRQALGLCKSRKQIEFCITNMEIATQVFWKDGTKELYDKAVELIEKKKSKKAVPLMEKAISINPKNVLFYYEIGYAWIDLGDIAKAIEYLEKGRVLNPSSRKILNELKYCYAETGEIKKLREVIDKIKFLYGEDPSLDHELAFAFGRAGQIDSATVLLESVLERYPDRYFSAYLLADMLHENKQDPEKVCQLMRQFLDGVEDKSSNEKEGKLRDSKLEELKKEARKILSNCSN